MCGKNEYVWVAVRTSETWDSDETRQLDSLTEVLKKTSLACRRLLSSCCRHSASVFVAAALDLIPPPVQPLPDADRTKDGGYVHRRPLEGET